VSGKKVNYRSRYLNIEQNEDRISRCLPRQVPQRRSAPSEHVNRLLDHVSWRDGKFAEQPVACDNVIRRLRHNAAVPDTPDDLYFGA